MRKFILVAAIGVVLGCLSPIKDTLIDDDGVTKTDTVTKVDTLVIERPVPQPPDTVLCVIKRHHCWPSH